MKPIKLKQIPDVYKNLAILACIVAVTYFMVITCTRSVEGLTPTPSDATTIANADPDLKCSGADSGSHSQPAKCATTDLMKMAYDVASDPRLSVTELNKMSEVCNKRKFEAYQNFAFTTMMLRAATMYNTTANEAFFKEILEDMTKKKGACYDNEFMKSVKGLLVGSKDELTLTVAQSEAIRCYAHRFNAFKKCLNACK
jgi:hypothetical protein